MRHVNIASFNRKVLLTGEVRDEAAKAAVEREVRAIEGVQTVANELEIAGPSSYTSRSSDALITTKVKASLVDMKTISATSFKVVTERGMVYLMGRVTQREGQVAADVARGVSGVQKVVKIFEYISEDELRALAAAEAADAAVSKRHAGQDRHWTLPPFYRRYLSIAMTVPAADSSSWIKPAAIAAVVLAAGVARM